MLNNKKINVSEFTWILIGEVMLMGLIYAEEQGVLGLLSFIRAVLGLVYVLFIPGYALQVALFPLATDLDGPERVALSFGFSIALVAPVALLLDRLPWGIQLWTIVLAECLLLIILTAAAIWRRGRLAIETRYLPILKVNRANFWAAQDRTARLLWIILGASLLIALGLMVSFMVLPSPAEFYTEFYILGKDGLAEDYPREAIVGEPITVTFGITNLEKSGSTYQIRIEAEGQLLFQQGPIVLNKDENREQVIEFSILEAGDNQQVKFFLDRMGDPIPYRSLLLWVNVISTGSP